MRPSRHLVVVLLGTIAHNNKNVSLPPPPQPEPIEVIELPLPPTAPTDDEGQCTLEINPHGTGCMSKTNSFLQNGNFLPDGKHVLASLAFAGAPAAPDPASIYNGTQLVVVKIDGTTFSNGDAWKCLTCGVPAANMAGSWVFGVDSYPQAFHDEKRVLFSYNIIDCDSALLVDDACTPEQLFVYPIRWNINADGSGASGDFREVRVHPDNVHIGFNAFTFSGRSLGEVAYFARLQFNPSPTIGLPLSPRYDLINVTTLHNPDAQAVISADGDRLIFNASALGVGELRGFTGRGKEVTYIGANVESCNVDAYAADLTTGAVRRLTSDTGYTDPLDISPDDQWSVVLTTYGSRRMEFLSAMRRIPPITDLVTSGFVASVRNNGFRRFFQPWLLDYHGDRGTYVGQQINADGDGSPGSINDPNWNTGADPHWSPDGTRIVYFQQLVTSPDCGGENPLPCPISTAPGGRNFRLMLATLTSRKPVKLSPVEPISDIVPWGTPYVPGSELTSTPSLLDGNYTLKGKVSGSALATFTLDRTESFISNVAVTYHNYSDDGLQFISGNENITATPLNLTLTRFDWYSNLVSTGETYSTKLTSPDGFHATDDEIFNIFEANGTLTTTVDGVVYRQPANGS
ncbi:hypothetical protein F5884DRAFT_846614 [Xylogone sp. PMI_703]|nr:hypothetical protein F5884DRAFT_846614 [Xylogone sp. PMI_703]